MFSVVISFIILKGHQENGRKIFYRKLLPYCDTMHMSTFRTTNNGHLQDLHDMIQVMDERKSRYKIGLSCTMMPFGTPTFFYLTIDATAIRKPFQTTFRGQGMHCAPEPYFVPGLPLINDLNHVMEVLPMSVFSGPKALMCMVLRYSNILQNIFLPFPQCPVSIRKDITTGSIQ